MIHWAAGLSSLQVISLEHWVTQIEGLKLSFSYISFNHIYRDLNSQVDSLLKKVIGAMDGILHFLELFDDQMMDLGEFHIY